MSYPYLPVNPCCTDVVINTPCGCSSTITNTGCNNDPCSTNLTASSTIVYDGPALTCTTAEPCDTINVILQKIDQIICNLLTQINTLTTQVDNITTQVITINNDIINIDNQLGVCCTTTTTTTSAPCIQWNWNLTGISPSTVTTLEYTQCGTGAHVIITQAASSFGNPFIFCSTTAPIITLGSITSEGNCPTTTTTTTVAPTTTTTTTVAPTTTTTTTSK